MNNKSVGGSVDIWIDKGQWKVKLTAPKWVLEEIAHEILQCDKQFRIATFGGGVPTTTDFTMLLAVTPKDETANP